MRAPETSRSSGNPGEQWIEELLDELAAFPNGKYKDQVDCCTGAFNKLALGCHDFGPMGLFGDESDELLTDDEVNELPDFLREIFEELSTR